MEYHEAASIFPLDEEHIPELVESIRRVGLLDPIRVYDGEILDGRRRYIACKKAGVEPRFDKINPPKTEIVDLVWGWNVPRRQLSESQLSMCATDGESLRAKYIAADEKKAAEERKKKGQIRGGRSGGSKESSNGPMGPQAKNKGRARGKIAERYKISGRTVERAKTVRKKGSPEIIKAVEKGKLSVRKAEEIVKYPKSEQPKRLQEEIEKKKKPKQKPTKQKEKKDKPLSLAVEKASKAIEILATIPKNDPFRKRSFQIVREWMTRNK